MPDAKFQPEWLQGFRSQEDPVAAAIIEKIESQYDFSAIHELFDSLTTNKDINSDLKSVMDGYFVEYSSLPSWADPEKIKVGQELFANYGPEISTILLFKALPACYACGNGARILYNTGRLTTHDKSVANITRRVMETSQFVINVLSPGSFEPDGKAIPSILKVRLMHAVIRYYIYKAIKNRQHLPSTVTLPDIEKEGVPINQEDMAGTFLAFSIMISRGLKALNLSVTPEQEEAYLHIWRVVGHMIGVSDELMPASPDDAHDLAVAIVKHQARETEWGQALVEANFECIRSLVPGNLFYEFPPYMSSFLLAQLGQETNVDFCKIMKIESHDHLKDRIIMKVMQAGFNMENHVESHHFLLGSLFRRFNTHFLKGLSMLYNNQKESMFNLPPALTGTWDLMDAGDEIPDYVNVVHTPALLGYRLSIEKKNALKKQS